MRIVFIGHSIVEGYPFGKHFSFPRRLSRMFTGVEILNCGISGESNRQILNRFSRDALSEEPDFVFIMGGSNDFIFNLSSVEEALTLEKQMEELCIKAGIQCVHISPPPVKPLQASGTWGDMTVEEYQKVNQALEEYNAGLCRMAGVGGTGYIDVFDEYKAYNCYIDGVHPDDGGQELIADICRKWIDNNSDR